ncbi:MAG: hypothetical protein R3B47_01645 [Bacteroidia bacterium]
MNDHPVILQQAVEAVSVGRDEVGVVQVNGVVGESFFEQQEQG